MGACCQKKNSENVKDFGGGKTIGMFASVALLINNITGPGVPQLPNMFAEAGWLVPTLVFLAIWAMSSLSTTMYCEAMRRIPGNENFKGRIEYTTIVKHYFGNAAYWASQVGLNGALQSLNIISIIQSAQVMDALVMYISSQNRTYGLDFTPIYNGVNGSTEFFTFVQTDDVFNPWGCHIVVSVGFALAACITLPMGVFNLDDNMGIQTGAFIITLICWVIWFVACFFSPAFADNNSTASWHIPAVKTGGDYTSQAGVLGTILFNFGFVTTVPSWVNEKKENVSVNKTTWLSTFLCVVIFFAIGIPGAMGFQNYLAGPATGNCEDPRLGGCKDSIMSVLTDPSLCPKILYDNIVVRNIIVWSVYLFPIVAVMSSIPVFSIVIKYNCIENGCSKGFSLFWGIFFPWILALPISYTPNALNSAINFTSLIFVSFTDFIVPWVLYVILQHRDRSVDPLLNDKEQTLLSIQDEASHNEKVSVIAKNKEDQPDNNPDVVVHWALPPEWNISHKTKMIVALTLVVLMAAACVVGIVESIEQTSSTPWVCANVSLP